MEQEDRHWRGRIAANQQANGRCDAYLNLVCIYNGCCARLVAEEVATAYRDFDADVHGLAWKRVCSRNTYHAHAVGKTCDRMYSS